MNEKCVQIEFVADLPKSWCRVRFFLAACCANRRPPSRRRLSRCIHFKRRKSATNSGDGALLRPIRTVKPAETNAKALAQWRT